MTAPLDIANRWIAAYNARDFDMLANLMSPDIHVEHHNRGALLNGAESMLAVMRQFAELLPDRRFHSLRRQFVAGDTVVESDEGFTVTLSNPSTGLTIGIDVGGTKIAGGVVDEQIGRAHV